MRNFLTWHRFPYGSPNTRCFQCKKLDSHLSSLRVSESRWDWSDLTDESSDRSCALLSPDILHSLFSILLVVGLSSHSGFLTKYGSSGFFNILGSILWGLPPSSRCHFFDRRPTLPCLCGKPSLLISLWPILRHPRPGYFFEGYSIYLSKGEVGDRNRKR